MALSVVSQVSPLLRAQNAWAAFRRAGRTPSGDHDAPGQVPRVLLTLGGCNSAWSEVGHQLYRVEPAFRQSVDAFAGVVEHRFGYDLRERFRSDTAPDRVGVGAGGPDIIQRGVSQMAGIDLLRSHGLAPTATLGISLGELGAAYAAGALSREDVIVVLSGWDNDSLERARDGQLYLLNVDQASARRLCESAPAPVLFIGTTDHGQSIVLTASSDAGSVGAFLVAAAPIEKQFPSPSTFHTPARADQRQRFEKELHQVVGRPATCAVYSAAAGGLLTDPQFDARHWHWVSTRPFNYADAIDAAVKTGIDVVLAFGADATQQSPVRAAAEKLGGQLSIVDMCIQDEATLAVWHRALAELRELGVLTPAKSAARAPSAAWETARRPSTPAALKLDSPETARNPFVHYEDLRRQGTVHFLPRDDIWLVVGYEEVSTAFSRPQLFSSQLLSAVDPVMLGADGPAHAMVRRRLSAHFSASALNRIMPGVDRFAEKLLSPLGDGDELDVVRGLATPLAHYTAARLLLVDDETAREVSPPELEVETEELFQRLDASLEPIIQRSGLAAELRDDPRFDEAQIRSLIRLLWIAATSTTKHVITSSILLLTEVPAIRAGVLADAGLLSAFVEESIRLHPPELLIGRRTTADATLGTTTIPAGSLVQLGSGAANRDPRRFTEPTEVRLNRSGRHIAFGSGSHGCPGARLARAETHSALSALLRLAPDYELVQPRCMLRYLPAATTHGLYQLVIARSASG
jgi:cytochrome P450